jgi:hypothetical protein
MAIAIALGGCGAGSDDEEPAEARSPVPEEAKTVDERFDVAGSKGARAWGDGQDNRKAVAVLREMQENFRAERMGAVCKHVDEFMLSQFDPGSSQRSSPCPDKLEAFARVLDRRGGAGDPIKLLWVRSYGWEAGVWVESSAGKRIRVPFKSAGDADWKLELGSFGNPEVLASTLDR